MASENETTFRALGSGKDWRCLSRQREFEKTLLSGLYVAKRSKSELDKDRQSR
jgi:hypothetical protein